MESGYAYPERSGNNLARSCGNGQAETGVRSKNNIMVLPEVSRGHSKPETSCNPMKRAMWRTHAGDEGLNVRRAKELEDLW